MFDLNVNGSSYETNLELAMQASNYGWHHLSFSYSPDEFGDALSFKKDLKDKLNDFIDIDYTLSIKSNNPSEIRKIVRKYRNKSSCISVLGGNLKVNRNCLENIQVDVLSKPYFKRYDSGLNHILAREAKDNNVAIELVFNDILKSYLAPRSKILANFRDIYKLHRKYEFPLILSSGAQSIFDIRTVMDFKAVFMQTGLTDLEVENSFKTAENILEFNKDRKNMILSGVKVVE
ncbi:ribonuclease P protein component 3 [Methanobrevibacter millerae]|uniref:Ribonuclease P protein component 3 n=1 Tax=Methanobrevibacter millerae TaxID=230361 RepID=A0A0U3DKS9_9EURY|nr:RNase P subunit p30 family protein [Methanobrevibacter millerae]ALT68598.1 ribonuclease P subunit P30 [Methanobrevibacter millerae]MBO6109365.1 ribonuclease P [Methanobrevibacter sp.]